MFDHSVACCRSKESARSRGASRHVGFRAVGRESQRDERQRQVDRAVLPLIPRCQRRSWREGHPTRLLQYACFSRNRMFLRNLLGSAEQMRSRRPSTSCSSRTSTSSRAATSATRTARDSCTRRRTASRAPSSLEFRSCFARGLFCLYRAFLRPIYFMLIHWVFRISAFSARNVLPVTDLDFGYRKRSARARTSLFT